MAERRLVSERRKVARAGSKDRRETRDRRRKKRFRVKEGAFAALVNSENKLGQIKDISLVGLSFRYIDSEGRANHRSELRIILAGAGLFLDKVPYKTVSDFEVTNGFTFSSLKMRQRHLAFGELSPYQESRLNDFILKYTMGEA
ncbi:MAG: PilZ domain-containing protein [Deltaproteobacteria bacterium]|jgi:hypothetical protein|nr:MAG: PilZ domain-containing protein [Deltaproteobacteria bacterium]